MSFQFIPFLYLTEAEWKESFQFVTFNYRTTFVGPLQSMIKTLILGKVPNIKIFYNTQLLMSFIKLDSYSLCHPNNGVCQVPSNRHRRIKQGRLCSGQSLNTQYTASNTNPKQRLQDSSAILQITKSLPGYVNLKVISFFLQGLLKL